MSTNLSENSPIAPILKWAGGKRQLLDELAPRLPERFSLYAEPFLGGGALLFHLRPAKALVNDANAELINVYRVIQHDAQALVASLSRHRNEAEYYYEIRNHDRDEAAFAALSPVERASRAIYLNKTCYNGLYRVNRAGRFNTPFGRYKNPNIVNAAAIHRMSRYLNEADVEFMNGDYAGVLDGLGEGAFVYFDPPYHPVSGTANFTGYTRGGFGEAEQIRLKEWCDRLDARGVRFMLSNSAAPFIRELYAGYVVDVVAAKRAVNSDPAKRGAVEEVVVRNYGGAKSGHMGR